MVAVDQIPSPGSVKVIQGEGIAAYDDNAVGDDEDVVSKGDLYVKFEIEFPKRIPGSQAHRSMLVDALTPSQ